MDGSSDLELGLRLGVGPHEAEDRTRATAEVSASGSGRSQREHLTILYKGEVCIYKNVSEAQAKAIMLLAGCGERPPCSSGSDAAKELTHKEIVPAVPRGTREGAESMERSSNAAASAMMMKRSLQRFLQKRKMRMRNSSASPY